MKGFYLYCVKKGVDGEFSTKGIGDGKIFAIPYQDLETVVSEVSLEEFDSKEIQRKAQEDLGWIKNKAQIHEKVIEEAMGLKKPPYPLSKNLGEFKGLTAVIPMKFGTVFKTKKSLEETLEKYYSKFREVLKNLEGKQEWSVKIYLNRRAFEKEVKKVSLVVQEKEAEIASLPEGTAYFMQKQIDDAAAKEADKVLENYTESFFENLKKYAEAATKSKILEKELTGKSLPMILNAIFLVSEEKIKNFLKEVDKLTKDYQSKGFVFEPSGPWPAYNFVM